MDAYFDAELRRRPLLSAQDAVKFCYQATFGARHLLTAAEEDTEKEFDLEWDAAAPEEGEISEEISPVFSRVFLRTFKGRGFSKEDLYRLFTESVRPPVGTDEEFLARLSEIEKTAKDRLSPEGCTAFRAYFDGYLAGGIRPVHHSEAFRAAYRPSYRLVKTEALRDFLLKSGK